MIKILFSINLFLLSTSTFFSTKENGNQEITLCTTSNKTVGKSVNFNSTTPFEIDPNKAYTLPTFTKNTKGDVVLYWAEKDDKNVVSLCFATSTDDGKTFGEKQLIYADAGIGTGRLARPKLLFKKDGTMVAVFSYRSGGAMPPRAAQQPEMKPNNEHANHEKPAAPPAVQRPKRESQIRFTESKDGGKTWTEPKSVDNDPTPLVRGFFDAVVLPNNELAVAYLKDVKNSTKHEERDLRLVITKNGVFQDERLIDPVVCDCCNISLLVDTKGNLNVFYRDNNNEIRDIARLTSNDNGATFDKSQPLYNDKWEINGCPHAGASSVATTNGAYITWFSGTPENTGVRLVNEAGKLMKILDVSAKNGYLAADKNTAAWIWEQTSESGEYAIFWSKIENGKLADSQQVSGSEYGQNPSAWVVNGKVLVAYEVARPNQKTTMEVKLID